MDIALLETSFEQIKPQAIAFSASFYDTLFHISTQLKPMFASTSKQAKEQKLIFSLAAIVDNLRNPEILGPALASLGARHLQVGTLEEHYPLVGHALLNTLADYLGDSWTPELSQHWLTAYEAIANTMLDGTQNPEQHLEPELTFYDWIDLYGEENSQLKAAIAKLTQHQYNPSNSKPAAPSNSTHPLA